MLKLLLSLLAVVTMSACGSRPPTATQAAAPPATVSHRAVPDRSALVSTPDDGLLAFGDGAAKAIGCSVRFICATNNFRYTTRSACVTACGAAVLCEQACCYTGGGCIYP